MRTLKNLLKGDLHLFGQYLFLYTRPYLLL